MSVPLPGSITSILTELKELKEAFDQIQPYLPQPSESGGTYVGKESPGAFDGDGYTIVQTCEVWRFPDGLGGYYYLRLNCSVSSLN